MSPSPAAVLRTIGRRHHRGRPPDPEEGDHEDEEGQRGNGLHHPRGAEDELPGARAAGSDDAEGHGHRDGREKRDGDEDEMLPGVPEDPLDHPLGPGLGAYPERARDELRGDPGRGDPVQLGAGVHPPHRLGVDAALEAAEREGEAGRAPGKVGAVEEHRLVGREVAEVVGEHAQAVVRDLGIGLVEIGRVDGAALEGAGCEVVLETTNVTLR